MNALNQLDTIDLVHLPGGRFMENMRFFTDAVARHGRIGRSHDARGGRDHRLVDRMRKDVEATYLERFGTPETWLDDSQALDALNNHNVLFHGSRSPLPTTMESFVRDVWKPRYLQSVAGTQTRETFHTGCSRD